MLSKLETELLWLTKRVSQQEDYVKRLTAYFEQFHEDWPAGVAHRFKFNLQEIKDQLYFEATHLEKLAWKIHDEREGSEGRDSAFSERLIE